MSFRFGAFARSKCVVSTGHHLKSNYRLTAHFAENNNIKQ